LAGLEALRVDPVLSSGAGYGDGALIICDRLVRIYSAEGIEVQALQGLDLLIAQGELVAMVGASGSGKSTLMNILAGLDTPTAGRVRVAGQDLGALSAKERLIYRRQQVGFIWQQTSRNLLPYLTAKQNVVMPMRFDGYPRRLRNARAMDLLDILGVAHCANRIPSRLSGGEQQRVALARALANEPSLLLADEPTGNLDSANTNDVLRLLRRAHAAGQTILMVTHDAKVAGLADRVISLFDGMIADDAKVVPAPRYHDKQGRQQALRNFLELRG
jgi:ABC-type lipoprotein export system ATPase subunit